MAIVERIFFAANQRFPRDHSAEEKRKKRYVLQMAKQFGWKIKRPRGGQEPSG